MRRFRRIRCDQSLFAGFGNCRGAVIHIEFEIHLGKQVADGRVFDIQFLGEIGGAIVGECRAQGQDLSFAGGQFFYFIG